MVEIKISVSDQTDKIISEIVSELGIKKSEFVKSLVVKNLKEIHQSKRKK